jgi:WhiB family redox-sensing transcriptional regulator
VSQDSSRSDGFLQRTINDMITVTGLRRRAPLGSYQQADFSESSRHLPKALESEWEWQLQGRCRAYPAHVFFPDDDRGNQRREREEQAKRVCRACPVLAACRSHALQVPERFGVWGAMTARERARTLNQTEADRRGA